MAISWEILGVGCSCTLQPSAVPGLCLAGTFSVSSRMTSNTACFLSLVGHRFGKTSEGLKSSSPKPRHGFEMERSRVAGTQVTADGPRTVDQNFIRSSDRFRRAGIDRSEPETRSRKGGNTGHHTGETDVLDIRHTHWTRNWKMSATRSRRGAHTRGIKR